MITSATLDLRTPDERSCGTLEIACLPDPKNERWQSLDSLENTDAGEVRLLEEMSYRYTITLPDDLRVKRLEPSEIFSADHDDKLSGRLSAGRVTGTIRVQVVTQDEERLLADLEVRSRKLDYETEYRRMMQRLADEGAELVQQAFAAGSFGGFDPNQIGDARTLYQRFAFLEALLDSEVFNEAVEVVRYRPHIEHVVEEELVDPARYSKPARDLARQLAGPGERQSTHFPVAGLRSLPRTLRSQIHVESLDTVPNQFLRFAFEHWRDLTGQVIRNLSGSGPAARRGRAAAARIEARLDQLLLIPAVVEVSRLRRFPTANTVLTGRSGYREIFRFYLLGNVATSLTWKGGEDVFGAGKRDVAALYEYWVFLELARIVQNVTDWTPDRSELVAVTDDEMRLELRRGRSVVLSGKAQCGGRSVDLDLWFNREFHLGAKPGTSWSARLRPDCSLRIRPRDGGLASETWVHFDAKYRVTDYTTFFSSADEDEGDGSGEAAQAPTTPTSAATRADLHKMHAYRDAIRRSSGAYVLYPGDADSDPEERREYHELLPGVGAFVLKPDANGEATPTAVAGSKLQQFLRDVIEHAAATGTARERAEFWKDEAYRGWSATEGVPSSTRSGLHFQPALERPPADTQVLLGFVRSAEHLEWIRTERFYNLRADPERRGSVAPGSPALHTQFVVLYDSGSAHLATFRTRSEIRLSTRAQLLESGYPDHHASTGQLYLCVGLGEEVDLVVPKGSIPAHQTEDRAPAVLSWEAFASSDTPLSQRKL